MHGRRSVPGGIEGKLLRHLLAFFTKLCRALRTAGCSCEMPQADSDVTALPAAYRLLLTRCCPTCFQVWSETSLECRAASPVWENLWSSIGGGRDGGGFVGMGRVHFRT
eukprot:353120-Chlamydomonas_euryale.AAC.13